MRAWTLLVVLAWPLCAAAQGPSDATPATAGTAAATFSGVDRQLAVRPPRLDAEVVIDGALDEPAWQQASQLVGLLALRAGGRRSGRTGHRGAGVVFADGDALRRAGLGAAGHGAGHARRSRSHRRRRSRPVLPQHVCRWTPGFRLRREPLRRADGRRAGRGCAHRRRRLRRPRPRPRGRRPQPRLRLPVARPPGTRRLRGRDPDPLQEPALPVGRRAVLGAPRHPCQPGGGRRGQLGPGPAPGRVVPVAGRLARWAPRPAARAGARSQPGGDRAGRRREERRRRALGLRGFAARLRPQRALGRDPDPDPERHGQPRLLAGGIRRRTVPVRSAPGAVLPRQAAVLPRRHRAVRHAQQPDLHPPHRGAAHRRQAHRAGDPRHERRLPVGGRRPVDVASSAATIRSSTSCARSRTSARRRRWRSSTPIASTATARTASPASTRGWCGRRSTACCCRARAAAPTPAATAWRRRSGRRPSTAPAAATACEPWPRASIRTSSRSRASSAGPASPASR